MCQRAARTERAGARAAMLAVLTVARGARNAELPRSVPVRRVSSHRDSTTPQSVFFATSSIVRVER